MEKKDQGKDGAAKPEMSALRRTAIVRNRPIADLRRCGNPRSMNPSVNAKLAFNELVRLWGSRPKVFRHGDDAESSFVNIAHFEDSPVDGVTSVATLGLSDHDLGLGRVRVELIGAFPSSFKEGVNVAATCAFNALKDGVRTAPNAVHSSVLSLYRTHVALPHIMLVDPFLWDNGPSTLDAAGVKIAWLMMVPISDSERVFAIEHGGAALGSRFEQAQIDIFDLDRRSVV